MSETTANLREKFIEACQHESLWEQHDRALERGHNGTPQDFYKRFDEIATGLKPALEKLIAEVESGKSVIGSLGDAYKHFGEPLKYEIVFPSSMSEAEEERIERGGLYAIPGYQKLHEVCASKEIDMNFITAFRSNVYRTPVGKAARYHSILIEISPDRPYYPDADFEKYKNKTHLARNKGNVGPV